jgi:short-subunit dehydrogenase|tara:strand:- start:862 stop:1650 length:789 start_codon:yes stop_codon:yes gene_type:complete
MIEFKGKTVWITGASSGIGKALAIKLGSLGANLVLSSRKKNQLMEVAKLCNTEVLVLPIDLEKSSNFSEKVSKVVSKFKSIDLLINNGGISQRSRAYETDIEVDRKIMEVNYFGTIALTKSILPIMQKQKSGYITTVSSSSGKFGFFLRSSYSASKFAQVGFFESLRLEEEKNNIFISIVFPFLVKTNISLNAISEKGIANKKNDPLIEKGISPEKCAQDIIDGIMNQKKEIFSGGKGAWILNIKRFFPELFFKIMRKQIPN